MSNINPESLKWIDDMALVCAQAEKMPDASHAELAKILNIPSRSTVTYSLAINACFNQTALEKVRKAASPAGISSTQPNPATRLEGPQQLPYIFSFRNAQALSRLKGRVSDPFGAVNGALDVILAQQLDTRHIKAMVNWIIAGKPLTEFDPKAKPVEPEELAVPEAKLEDSQPIKAHKTKAPATLGQRLDAFLESAGSPSVKTTKTTRKASKKQSGLKTPIQRIEKFGEWVGKIAWRDILKYVHHLCKAIASYMVPVNHFSQGRHKHSGPHFSLAAMVAMILHWFVYTLCMLTFWWFLLVSVPSHFVPSLQPWAEWPFRFLAHEMFSVLSAWVIPQLFHDWIVTLAVGAVVIGIITAFKAQPARMAVVAVLISLLWNYGKGWNAPLNLETVEPSRRQDTQVAAGDNLENTSHSFKPETKPKTESVALIPSAPVMAVDLDWIQRQVKVIPNHSRIEPYSFQPNFAMGADMAGHRLMDLQSKDKYTVLWGTDKETVTNLYAGASNLSLTLQNGLVGAFLGGPAKVNIYWEEIKALYANVIKSGSGVNVKTTYELFIHSADLKNTLAIQCATGADLEHLVSALEFYIKLSSRDAASIGSLPYLNQGLMMDHDGEATLLWAESPVGKIELNFGDILWSVDANPDKQQTKAQIEASLGALTSGLHKLYAVNPAEWKRALKESNTDSPETFYPIRKRLSLSIP